MVKLDKDIVRFIENGNMHYEYKSNILAYVLKAIDENLKFGEVVKIALGIYFGYEVDNG